LTISNREPVFVCLLLDPAMPGRISLPLARSTQPVKTDHRSKHSSRILVRSSWIVFLLCFLAGPILAQAQQLLETTNTAVSASSSSLKNAPSCHIIYLGIVGALEPPNNKYSGVVQIREALQAKGYFDVCAKSFSPYTWMQGRDWLLKHFPSHPGELTSDELQRAPKVILVGHSMGGWAILSVARELSSRHIPVELTVQVDSVGITDHTVPKNVKSAAIFHANDVLMFMTTKSVRREDPNYTKLVADVLVAGAGHESITRDPRIRTLVMDTVESLRASRAQALSTQPQKARTERHSAF
jgi:hypothetical protein